MTNDPLMTHQGIPKAEFPIGKGYPFVITHSIFGIPWSLVGHLSFHISQSTQRELNPHIRHGKAAGSRYIMGALSPTSEARGT